jgi:Outer membrane protein beta-barrel domain
MMEGRHAMKTSTALLVPAILAACLARNAAATNDGRYRIDLRAGALAWGQDPKVRGGYKLETADAGPALGIGGGYRLNDHFDIGGSGQAASKSTVLFGRTTSYTSLTAGPRYYPFGRDLRFRPWLAGEAGWYHGRSTLSLLLRNTRTERSGDGGGLNAGTGFDVPVGRLVSLGADVRYHQTLGVFGNNPGFVTTMANVSFHFGK